MTPKFIYLRNLDLWLFMFLPSKGYSPLEALALNSLRKSPKLFSGPSAKQCAMHNCHYQRQFSTIGSNSYFVPS